MASNNPNNNFDYNNHSFTNAQLAFNGGSVTSTSVTNTAPEQLQRLLSEQGRNASVNVALAHGPGSTISQGQVQNILVPTATAPAPSATPAGPKTYYEMGASTGPKRGRVVVLNYEKYTDERHNRKGSQADVDKIRAVFGDELNFEVKVYDKVNTRRKTETALLYEADNFDTDSYHCFVLIILAHGESGYFLCDIDKCGSSDEQKFSYSRVLEIYDGANCPAMNTKPKLFFIQACQGEANDQGQMRQDGTGQGGWEQQQQAQADRWQFYAMNSDPRINPVKADQLVFCCCYSNHFSMRDKLTGSWFIQDLCDVLKEEWRSQDLDSMLKLVKDRVKNRQVELVRTVGAEGEVVKQMPEVRSDTLTKTVKFY